MILGFAALSQEQLDPIAALAGEVETSDRDAGRALRRIADSVAPIQRGLRNIMASAERGKEIVVNLTEFSKGHVANLVVGDVVATVRDVVKLLRVSLPASAELEIESAPGPLMAMQDRNKLERVLLNLCVNGAHALGGQAGHIRIQVGSARIDGGRGQWMQDHESQAASDGGVVSTDDRGVVHLWRGVLRAGDHIRIDVRDDGSGIDEATMKRVFETFFTTKPAGTGTGLGLASVANIVQEFGGAIHMRSRPGHGTTVSLYFPMVEAPKEKGSVDASSESAGSGQIDRYERRTAGHVLVVDDEVHLGELIELSLRTAGFTVSRFNNGLVAAEWLEHEPGDVDLVITDQTMPGLTGVMLAERATVRRPGLPIILCTGYSAQLADSEKLPKNVTEIIRKPFKPKDLVARARTLIDGRRAAG